MAKISTTEIREVNSKLFARDLIYDDEIDLEIIISHIIQNYKSNEIMADVPYILRLRKRDFNDKLEQNIALLSQRSAILQINGSLFEDHAYLEKIRVLKKEFELKLIVEIQKNETIFTHTNNLADYVKINVAELPEIMMHGSELTLASDIKRIAFNVNNAEQYKIAEYIKAYFYEGDYISEDTVISIERTKYSRINFNQIAKVIDISNENTLMSKEKPFTQEQINKLVTLISQDALLTAQLLRLSNSNMASNSDINDVNLASIKQAINSISARKFKTWLIMLQFSISENVKEEAIQLAYQRGVFCREIITYIRRHVIGYINYRASLENPFLSPRAAYLIGLLSTLDILTGYPIEDSIFGLGLVSNIENALLYREGMGGHLLNLAKAYDTCDEKHISIFSEKIGLFVNKNRREFDEDDIEILSDKNREDVTPKKVRDTLDAIYNESIIIAAKKWEEMREDMQNI